MRQKVYNSSTSSWEYVDSAPATQDGVVQSDTTARLTAGSVEPSNPREGDVWIDTSPSALNVSDTAVGINKVPTQGALDVDGEIYSNGEKVAVENDTDWAPLIAASGYTIDGARARYFNGVVYLKGQVTKNSGDLSGGLAAYIPPSIPNPDFTNQTTAVGSSTNTSKVGIYTNGEIRLTGPNNLTNYFYLDTQYPVGS